MPRRSLIGDARDSVPPTRTNERHNLAGRRAMKRQHRKGFGMKLMGDLSRRQFITRTTAAGVTLALPAWLAGCGDDGSSPPGATPTPTAVPTPGPRPVEDCDL